MGNDCKLVELVELDFAKELKKLGYWRACEYYYQDKDLPYSPSGLKRSKEKLNHNGCGDDFIYSAPTLTEGMDYFIGIKLKYESSVVINLGGKKTNE